MKNEDIGTDRTGSVLQEILSQQRKRSITTVFHPTSIVVVRLVGGLPVCPRSELLPKGRREQQERPVLISVTRHWEEGNPGSGGKEFRQMTKDTDFVPQGAGKKRKRVLLLVAHPDDECMFFGPTVLSITMQPTVFDLRVLCISSGNADGLGERRKLEMVSSCTVLKLPAEHVEVLDHPALQDGHKQVWNQQLLVEIIDQTVKSLEIDMVITFDSHGVSGHPNHSALSHALRAYILRGFKVFQSDADVPPVEGWELVSLNIVRKYSGVLEIVFSTLGWLVSRKKSRIHCFLTPNPLTSVAAMKQHESQWVWFRLLFVVFAAYTYVNVLKRIETKARVVAKTD